MNCEHKVIRETSHTTNKLIHENIVCVNCGKTLAEWRDGESRKEYLNIKRRVYTELKK